MQRFGNVITRGNVVRLIMIEDRAEDKWVKATVKTTEAMVVKQIKTVSQN